MASTSSHCAPTTVKTNACIHMATISSHAVQTTVHKSNQKLNTNHAKLVPKSRNLIPKTPSKSVLEGVLARLGGSWGGSWALLGGIVGVLRAKLATRWFQEPKNQNFGPPWMLTSSVKHSILRQKNDHMLDRLRTEFL